jgi:hypothetical protein
LDCRENADNRAAWNEDNQKPELPVLQVQATPETMMADWYLLSFHYWVAQFPYCRMRNKQ